MRVFTKLRHYGLTQEDGLSPGVGLEPRAANPMLAPHLHPQGVCSEGGAHQVVGLLNRQPGVSDRYRGLPPPCPGGGDPAVWDPEATLRVDGDMGDYHPVTPPNGGAGVGPVGGVDLEGNSTSKPTGKQLRVPPMSLDPTPSGWRPDPYRSGTQQQQQQDSQILMWVTTTSPRGGRCDGCAPCRHYIRRVAQPTLRTVGQCLFGLAILLIMAGIALCIWGYVGAPIAPFQVFGPAAIGAGLLIYMFGCVMCCRETPAFQPTLQRWAFQEKVYRSIGLLEDPVVARWIHSDPEMLDDFKAMASRVLNPARGQNTDSDNVISNAHATV